MGAARQLEQPDAGVGVAAVRAAVIADRLRDMVLLRTPLGGLARVERLADLAVQLVDIHRIEAVLELRMLGGQPRERLGVEALFVLMALPQRLGQEVLDVRVDVESS